MEVEVGDVVAMGRRNAELESALTELEAALTEWRDWYRFAFGTDYTAQGMVGRTEKLLQNYGKP